MKQKLINFGKGVLFITALIAVLPILGAIILALIVAEIINNRGGESHI